MINSQSMCIFVCVGEREIKREREKDKAGVMLWVILGSMSVTGDGQEIDELGMRVP